MPTWPCRLMMPGMMVLPLRSTVCAFAGALTCDAGPISRILSPAMTIVASAMGARPLPSITVACSSTVSWAASGSAAGASKPAAQAVKVTIVRIIEAFPLNVVTAIETLAKAEF